MTDKEHSADRPEDVPPMVRLKYRKGDLIVKEGGYGNVIYRVLEGRVRVFTNINNVLVSLAVLEKGEIIGEVSYFNHTTEPYIFSARAMDDCELELWHITLLEHQLNALPPLVKLLFDQPFRRLLRTRSLIQHLTKRKMSPPEDMGREAGEPEAAKRNGLEPKLLDDLGMDTALHKHIDEKRKEWAAQKRRHYRKKVDLKSTYWPMFSEKDIKPATGLIRDVSREGLGMEVLSASFAAFSHDVGDRFEVGFTLPNGQPVHLQAIVVSKRKGRLPHSSFLGMYVTYITYENQKRLGFFLMP